MTTKLYCYVDETGGDTKGQLFIVGMVLAVEKPDTLRDALEKIEKESGKGQRKWNDTRRAERRSDYISLVLDNPLFKNTLYYAHYSDTRAYVSLTRRATAQSILACAGKDHHASIFVDGLQKSEVDAFRVNMSRQGISVHKVRGIRKEQSDALIRLADAISGFARYALEDRSPFPNLLKRAIDKGFIRQVE